MVSQQTYLKLIEDIKKYDEYYYEQHAPLISDFEYDQLLKQLEEIEKHHPEWIKKTSPTQTVREKTTKGFRLVAHTVPMLSLANSYSKDEVEDFIKRVNKLLEREVSYSAELKMDGIAVSLRYEKGVFVRGLTRGDGKKGDDITENLKTISHLPKILPANITPDILEVRAEVYMSKKVFSELNTEKEEAGEDVFANPRNAAAGSLKLLDPAQVKKRGLGVMAYGLVEHNVDLSTQKEVHDLLKKLGFPTFSLDHFAVCDSISSLMDFVDKIEQSRQELPFEIDGVVIKVNTLKDWDLLGATGKTPRWAIAYKFAPLRAATIIKEITIQVGRTGVLTPVAELQPVFLAGSTISRATLHNEEEIQRKDIRVGDTVLIEKGGDVIPKVVSVDVSKRPSLSSPFVMPSVCPACHSQTIHKEGEVAFRCSNKDCSAQNQRRLVFFASKQTMDIDHLGEKVMLKLMERGFVKEISDIYRLTERELAELEGFKEKSIKNLLSSIEKSKEVGLGRFILSLGIPHVGAATAELIADCAQDVQKLKSLTTQELLAIEGIGNIVADSFLSYFKDPDHLHEINTLLELGVNPFFEVKKKIKEHGFNGKTFVLTGSLETLSRSEATDKIKERGGKVTSSVTKQTDYLLLGDEPGSKYDKAVELKIKILNEDEFKELL